MKINWGTGIFLFYTFFATTLFYQVYKSTQYDHSLVVEDYYAKDLAYQSTFDKLENSMALAPPLQVAYQKKISLVSVSFPKKMQSISGTVLLYRASNKKEDIQLPIKIGIDNEMEIDVSSLAMGKWKVEIDWMGDHISYLDRAIIEIPNFSYLSDMGTENRG